MSAEQDSRRTGFFSTARRFWRTMERENGKDVLVEEGQEGIGVGPQIGPTHRLLSLSDQSSSSNRHSDVTGSRWITWSSRCSAGPRRFSLRRRDERRVRKTTQGSGSARTSTSSVKPSDRWGQKVRGTSRWSRGHLDRWQCRCNRKKIKGDGGSRRESSQRQKPTEETEDRKDGKEG